MFYRNIRNLGILSNEDLDFVKSRKKEVKKKFIIQKYGKGNSVVLVSKADYLDKMENLLNDTQKFEKINLKNDGILSFAVNQEKRVENVKKKLVASNTISQETRRFIKPTESSPGVMHGLCKTQKNITDNCLLHR